MSLDNIVQITIDTKSLQMAQAGFGIPLIITDEYDTAEQRVKLFKDVTELSNIPTTSPLYAMAHTLMSQTPRIKLAKIGVRLKGESMADAIKAIINEDNDFYGILLLNSHEENIKDIISLAEVIAGKRYLAGIDVTEHHLDAVQELKAKGFANIFCAYQSNLKESLAAALMGKMLTKTPGLASWAFKELTGIKPQKINLELMEKLKTLNINRYISISDAGVSLDGKVAKGEYIDVIHGRAWLQVRMQERLFRLFMLNDKIPFTNKGLDLVRCEIASQLTDGVNRGFLAADPKPEVFIPNIEEIDAISREQRKLPNVTFSARGQLGLFMRLKSVAPSPFDKEYRK